MQLRRYRMFAAVTTSADAIDSMRIQRAGVIRQINICANWNSITDNAFARVELSRTAITEIGNAGGGNAFITQSIIEWGVSGNFVTSGLSSFSPTAQFSCNDRVNVGDPLYIHAVASGTLALDIGLIIVIEES